MKLTQKQKLAKTICWLRKTFPASLPVYTRQVTLKKKCGDCGLICNETKFLIRIDKNQPFGEKRDTILHEWAHTITWWECSRENHPNIWGEAYARIYRAWLKWDYGRGRARD